MDRDDARWRVEVIREAFAADIDEYRRLHGKAEGERRFAEENKPVAVAREEGNLLTTAGVTALWQGLTGALATVFSTANAAIGFGDSTTAEAAGQTNLLAATNAYRQAVDATFPTISGNTITFKATVGTANANFAWNEWGVFNAVGTGAPPAGGTMLNRKVASLGTKTSAGSWAFTVTISIS